MKKLEVRYIPLTALKHAEYNPRQISTHDMEQLKKSLANFECVEPLVVNTFPGREMVIVGGHQRSKAMLALGWQEAPCVAVYLPLEKEKELNIRLNRNSGDWDFKLLDMNFSADELLDYGFESFEIGVNEGDTEAGDNGLLTGSDDLGMVKLKESHEVNFVGGGRYGIPDLDPTMLATIPDKITVWAGYDATEECDHYFYNHGTDSTKGLDWKRTIVGFYTDDHRFEQFWAKPNVNTSKMLNRGVMSLVTPNFSLWANMARAEWIYSTFRARWLGRYFQEAGIKIVPDVQWSGPTSYDFCFEGIPKNAPCISVQLQTAKKSTYEKKFYRDGLRKLVEELKPQSLFVYGFDNADEILDGVLPKELHLISIVNRIIKRRKLMS